MNKTLILELSRIIKFYATVNPQKNTYPVSLDDSAAKITWPIYQHVLGKTLDKSWTKICNYEKDTS